MDPKDQVEMLKGAIGATAEMELLFYRATIQVGATMEEALKLTQAYLAAMIHGNNKDPQQNGTADE